MADAHKTHKKETEEKAKPVETKPEETKTEPVVVSDIVTETTERIEVIEEATADPLTEFKEKMTEEEESPISDVPPKKNFMWPILFIFVIALLMLGGIFVYKNNMKGEKVNVVTLSPTPTVMPQPTKAKIDLSKYEIKILNGSEVEGEAGRQKSNLEAEGFTVSAVGNAVNSDYTKTIIQAKKEVDKDFLDKLKSVLQSSFTLGEIKELSDDASMPIIIIIGSKKA